MINPQADFLFSGQAAGPIQGGGDYVRGDNYPWAMNGLPNYYDWVVWYNEMLALMY